MNVFELVSQYKQIEWLVDTEAAIPDDQLLAAWMTAEGDLNAKMENLGFAIKNREAILAGKQEAIKSMEASAQSVEKEIDRLKKLAIDILNATGHKKAGGSALTLSVVNNAPSVQIIAESSLHATYLREIPPVPASWAPDKKKIAEHLKEGVIVEGARLVQSQRLAIR